MNKKGQITVGVILLAFIGIIVGLVLLQASFPAIGQTTQTVSAVNYSFTPAAVGSCKDMVGQELIDTPTVVNATTGGAVSVNYTISERISSIDGLKRIGYCTTGAGLASQPVKITYTYGAEGYADDSGSRAVIPLIAILGAIAIALWVLYPAIKEKFGVE